MFLATILSINGYGQKVEIGQAEAVKDSTLDNQPKKFKTRFTPFLAPSYAPETEVMLVAGGLFAFKFEPLDQLVNLSSVPFSIGYSTNKSLLVSIRPYLYFNRDKYRLYGNIWIKNMPDNYFGVGYDLNSTIPRGEETSYYKRDWWQFDIRFLREIKKSLYGGLLFDFNHTIATDLNPVMASDEYIIDNGTAIYNHGLGLDIEYDSRDVPINAYSGVFLNASMTFYGNYLGTDFNYSVLVLDYRQYKTIKREGRTLAWEIKNRMGFGDVPWPEMSQLGTPFDLRGYRWGQYRDRWLSFGILEYRHQFMRKSPDKKGSMHSKHGFVTWVAAGTIFEDFSTIKNWLPNAGLGYRFEVQPRMNVRVDCGFGRDATGFYVSFNEAF